MNSEDQRPGFDYFVSDRQLRAFGSCTPMQRLQWLEEMREVTWRMASTKTKEQWKRLRQYDRS